MVCCAVEMFDTFGDIVSPVVGAYYLNPIKQGCRKPEPLPEMCGREEYNVEKERCCEIAGFAGMIYFTVGINERCHQDLETLCNGKPFDDSTFVCCKEPEWLGGEEFYTHIERGCPAWCGSQKYMPENNKCCEMDNGLDFSYGEVIDTYMTLPPSYYYLVGAEEMCRNEFQTCGRYHSYNPVEEQCCEVETVTGDITFQVVSIDRKCPAPEKLCNWMPFDPRTHVCCDRPYTDNQQFTVSIERGCPEFCGREMFNPAEEQCCELENAVVDIAGYTPSSAFVVISAKEECPRPENTKPCGEYMTFMPETEKCCRFMEASGAVAYEVFNIFVDCPEFEYCGKLPYNSNEEVCCKTQVAAEYADVMDTMYYTAPMDVGCEQNQEFCGREAYSAFKIW